MPQRTVSFVFNLFFCIQSQNITNLVAVNLYYALYKKFNKPILQTIKQNVSKYNQSQRAGIDSFFPSLKTI